MSANILPAAGAADGASLIVRLRDTVKAVKVHRNRLADLSRHCDSLLSTVREYSPLLVGTQAGTEADAIERAVERILRRMSGWAGLSDSAAFLRQNEIQAGIEECHRELTASSDKFNMVLGNMSNTENQTQHLVQQPDHRELVDMIALFLEEVRKYSQLLSSEAPQLSEPLVQSQTSEVDGGQSSLPAVSPQLEGPLCFMSAAADISGKVSKVSEHVVIEGSLLVFYHGEWTDDGGPTALGRLRDESPDSQTRFKTSPSGLYHRNILDCFGHITIEGIVYSVNPWIENGNIRDYIRVNPRADRLRLLCEVASGVEFLHEREIVHGDLCGKSVLINGDGRAIICGFGLSECSNPTLDLSRARWFAPERITSSGVTIATKEGDIWSFGSLCLEVFTGEDPYSSHPDLYVPVLLSQGTAPEHPGSRAVGLSPNMWQLMQSCWKIDPAERPSMRTIQSTIREMRSRRNSRQLSSGNLDITSQTPVSRTGDSLGSTETSFRTARSSPVPLSVRTTVGGPPLNSRTREPTLPPTPIETVDHQTETQVQTGHTRRISDPSLWVPEGLTTLVEEPPDLNKMAPVSSPEVPKKRSQSHSYTPPRPSTPSDPSPPLILSASRHQFTPDSSLPQTTSSTRDSGAKRRWPFMRPIRSRTNANTTPDVNYDSSSSSTPNSDALSVYQRSPPQVKLSTRSRALTTSTRVPNAVAPQISPSATLSVPLSQTRMWEPLSPAVLECLETMASDSESLVRHVADGFVSTGNLEGLVSRVITDTADLSKDKDLRDTFLTVCQLFSASERLFELLKRRFGSMEPDPRAAPSHIRSRYNVLLFIESWLKKGFEDEKLKCSARIKEFALAIRGSYTMETKAREIVSLIANPDYLCLRRPGSSARLRREPAERPNGLRPADLAAALTVVEGERFKYITHWDYVNFTRGRPSVPRRIEAFNIVHDSITVWVEKTVLHSDHLGERMKMYDEWVYAAQACRSMNNFSSAAAIVTGLTSSVVTSLALTCGGEVKPILHALARELSPTDGVYQNTLQQATTKVLIPWLDPLLSSLTSTFKDPILEVDGHPMIDYRICVRLAEQIDSLVRYEPPRAHPSKDVLSYVEFSLKSCVGDDVLRRAARSAHLVNEEQALLDRRHRMRLLEILFSRAKVMPARRRRQTTMHEAERFGSRARDTIH